MTWDFTGCDGAEELQDALSAPPDLPRTVDFCVFAPVFRQDARGARFSEEVRIAKTAAGKGSPHDSAWIMFLCVRNSFSLSRASQFGSTLVGNRRLGGLCLGSGGKDDAGDLTAKSQVRRMRCPALHLLQRRWSSARRLSRAPPPCSSSAAS